MIFHDRADGQDGDIEDAETGAGNQQRNDNHIVYGLFSLKFHHAPGDDILVGSMLTASKPVDHGMEHDHIKPCKCRRIEEVHPDRRQSLNLIIIENGRAVSQKKPGRKKDTTRRRAPFSELLYGFVDVLLPDDLHDIGSAQIVPGEDTGKSGHRQQKCKGDQQAYGIKGKSHIRAVNEEQPEERPDDPDKRKSGQNARRAGEAA